MAYKVMKHTGRYEGYDPYGHRLSTRGEVTEIGSFETEEEANEFIKTTIRKRYSALCMSGFAYDPDWNEIESPDHRFERLYYVID